MQATWFELFFGEEDGRGYPIIAAMSDDKCLNIFHLKSRSIAELKGIFNKSNLATEFLVAPKDKPVPTPVIIPVSVRDNALNIAVREASKGRRQAPGNEIDQLVLDPLRPIMVSLKHLRPDEVDSFYNWCAAWITYICRLAGIKIPDQYGNFFASVALVDSWRDMGRRTGSWVDIGVQLPKDGDIVCFNWDGNSTLDHIGIVRGLAPGAVLTCEGNAANQNIEGFFTRNLSTVDGFLDVEILANQLNK